MDNTKNNILKYVNIKAEIESEKFSLDSISLLIVSMANDGCYVEDIAKVTKLTKPFISQIIKDRGDLICINDSGEMKLTEKGKLALDIFLLKEFLQNSCNKFYMDSNSGFIHYKNTRNDKKKMILKENIDPNRVYDKDEIKGLTDHQNRLLQYLQLYIWE